jgi:hypothetical protein
MAKVGTKMDRKVTRRGYLNEALGITGGKQKAKGNTGRCKDRV